MTNKMRVLIVNNSIIPAKLYGGTERVIWYLGKELVKLGHEVFYLVKKGSVCDFASVIPINDNEEIINQIPDNIDIVHFNSTPLYIERIKKPYIITIHGNSNGTDRFDLNSIFVSKNHAERYGSNSYVYNGLDWDDYVKPNLSQERKYFHFLGNAAWRVKNVKGAIDIINQTNNQELRILGGVRFNINMGIRFTFSLKTKFHGMVGGHKKDLLLNGSKGLIFPVRWHEPFGLAIIESLYFGCPVFGTPYGSLPELVNDQVGFLSNNKEDIVLAIRDANTFSKKHCHEYALTEFNSKKMALNYLERYEKVLSNEKLNPVAPKIVSIPKNKFLDWK